MTQYIDKAALVAEIERIKVDAIQFPFEEYGTVGTCNKLLSFLDTLEVKEADLEKDVDRILEEYDWNYDKIDFYNFAKHFFELGLKAKKNKS